MNNLGFQSWGMAQKPQNQDTIGPWLIVLGRKAGEVARGAKVNEGYLSELISGKKKNPGLTFLQKVAKELGISVSALMKKPPSKSGMDRLSPGQVEALGSLLDELKPEE